MVTSTNTPDDDPVTEWYARFCVEGLAEELQDYLQTRLEWGLDATADALRAVYERLRSKATAG